MDDTAMMLWWEDDGDGVSGDVCHVSFMIVILLVKESWFHFSDRSFDLFGKYVDLTITYDPATKAQRHVAEAAETYLKPVEPPLVRVS